MEAYIRHVAAGNIDKELLAKIIHSVINRKELDEETKLEVIHAMEKSPLFSEDVEYQSYLKGLQFSLPIVLRLLYGCRRR